MLERITTYDLINHRKLKEKYRVVGIVSAGIGMFIIDNCSSLNK